MKDLMIRIFDTDGTRLTHTEKRLREFLRRYGVTADLEIIACHLEMGRQGFAGQDPVLLVNNFPVSAGRPISDEMLEDCSRRLAAWQGG